MISITDIRTTSVNLAAFDAAFIAATGTLLSSLTLNERSQLLCQGSIFAPTSAAVFVNGPYATLFNSGTWLGGGTNAVIDAYSSTTWNGGLTLTNTGTISTTGTTDTSAIVTRHSGLTLVNQGLISSTHDAAIELYDLGPDFTGGLNRITNDGTIDAHGEAAIISSGAARDIVTNGGVIRGAIYLNDGQDSVINSGRIEGDINLGSGLGDVRNTGTIIGTIYGAASAITVVNTGSVGGIYVSGNTVTIKHRGLADFITFGGGFNSEVAISGEVGGNVSAYGTTAGVNWKIDGIIRGGLTDTGTDSRYDLRGGWVRDGVFDVEGSDLYLLDSAIEINETGLGQDTVWAWCDTELAANVEQLELRGLAQQGMGNALDNRIQGTGLANRLGGGIGADSLLGLGGDDLLWGGDGSDLAEGGFGRDRLWGETGNDTLLGGGQSDTLEGGAGADQLTGGADADLFVFVSLSDSGLTTATRDTITDFTQGLDRIDLSGIDAMSQVAGDQAFSWGALAAGTAGRLALRVVGGLSYLEGDVTGDGLADFSIKLNGVTGLAVSDLVL